MMFWTLWVILKLFPYFFYFFIKSKRKQKEKKIMFLLLNRRYSKEIVSLFQYLFLKYKKYKKIFYLLFPYQIENSNSFFSSHFKIKLSKRFYSFQKNFTYFSFLNINPQKFYFLFFPKILIYQKAFRIISLIFNLNILLEKTSRFNFPSFK